MIDRSSRKHLLLLACTADRMELALVWRERHSRSTVATLGAKAVEYGRILSVLTPILPRRLRTLVFITRGLTLIPQKLLSHFGLRH